MDLKEKKLTSTSIYKGKIIDVYKVYGFTS